MKKWGFLEQSKLDYFPMMGDIRVFQNYPGGSVHGHIDMYNGAKWVSDYIEKQIGQIHNTNEMLILKYFDGDIMRRKCLLMVFTLNIFMCYNISAQNAPLKAKLKEFYLRYNATYHEKDDNRMYAMQDSLVHEYCTESFYSAYLAEIKENGRGWEEFIALVSSDDINIIKKTFKVRRIANRQYVVEYQILDSDINHKVIKELVSINLVISLVKGKYKICKVISYNVTRL